MLEADQPSLLPKYLQENEQTQEFKKLISTLPTEKGWVANHLHQYQGFWHTTRQLQGVVASQNHFKAHHTDILLVTTPKSGTTWLKALTFAALNRKNYPDVQNHRLLNTSPHVLVPFLELDLYLEKESLPDLDLFSSPRLFSTHLPFVSLPQSVKESNCKLIYLCRDPKDTFVSLWHFTNRLRPQNKGINLLKDSCEKFCRGVSLYGPFWDHVLGYWKEYLENPEKIMFLRFEEMKEQPAVFLRELAEFMGCPFSEEEESEGLVDDILKLCSFGNLSNLEVNKTGKLSSGEENRAFFRQGEVGDWKNYLTVEMIEQFNSITEKKLAVHGLRF